MSLKNAFEEIGTLFEKKEGKTKVMFNFASSGALAKQIEAGAPADVFASADQKEMDGLKEKGLIIANSRVNFAANTVVLIAPINSTLAIKSFDDLKSDSVKKIAIGDPATVPAGRYAEDVLNYYKILPAIKDKLVFGQQVRQVLDYVARAEVEAGVMYSTDAAIDLKHVSIAAVAPQDSHKPVVYPISVIKGSPNEELARKFISLVSSDEGQAVLNKYGFKPAK
ncbi:molybdenum ABC transporter periplasmic molybdate-binding protein [Candidatus Magnetoovum chiemensis]|nr:molybdenum ABC transporter periplasmic molybdate-binding protein [Candidatus Magnetoovum chiemensis]